jgi:hypothetical protein
MAITLGEHMNKLTTFTAALAINGLIMAGVVYLFALQVHPHLSAIAFAHRLTAHQWWM